MLEKIVELTEGYKSYTVAVLTAIYTLLKAFGFLNTTIEQDTAVYALLAAMFGASIRKAIN